MMPLMSLVETGPYVPPHKSTNPDGLLGVMIARQIKPSLRMGNSAGFGIQDERFVGKEFSIRDKSEAGARKILMQLTVIEHANPKSPIKHTESNRFFDVNLTKSVFLEIIPRIVDACEVTMNNIEAILFYGLSGGTCEDKDNDRQNDGSFYHGKGYHITMGLAENTITTNYWLLG